MQAHRFRRDCGKASQRTRFPSPQNAIDALPLPAKDIVYWDTGSPGFGVKVTPKGRKVFIVLYRSGGAGSRLRKYTIGPYGRVTLHQARVAAQKIYAARLEGRDPASEKREAKRRMVADRVHDLLEAFIAQHHSQNRSGREISRYRPNLMRADHRTNTLWLSSTDGRPMTAKGVALTISTTTRRTVGVDVSPHLFRTAAATTAAMYGGATPHLASALLNHRDPYVTEEHYNRATSLSAAHAYASIAETYRKAE